MENKIRVIRRCTAETKKAIIKEVNEPHSYNYWHMVEHPGLVVGLYKIDNELSHLDKNNYIGEGGNFIDIKCFESPCELQRHYYSIRIISSKSELTKWSFEVDIKDIIGYAGIRLENNFLCDGVELRPKARIYNIKKHTKDKITQGEEVKNVIRYLEYVEPHFNEPYGIHGIEHTKRVTTLTLLLCEQLKVNDIEKGILSICGCLHDIGRINDFTDETHGKLSVDKIKEYNLLNGANKQETNIINFIIENHCISDCKAIENLNESNLENKEEIFRLFSIFKDADALDRVRLNDLDINYLRYEQSKALVNTAWGLYYESIF